MKTGGAGKCLVYICNICKTQITSVRFGGYQSEEIGDDIHICSSCCAEPGTLTDQDKEKALEYIKIYDALGKPDNVESLPYWPRTLRGTAMPFKKILAIAEM